MHEDRGAQRAAHHGSRVPQAWHHLEGAAHGQYTGRDQADFQGAWAERSAEDGREGETDRRDHADDGSTLCPAAHAS